MTLARVALAGMLAFAGCGVDNLSFVQDDRVSIKSPDDRATVELPVTLRWTVEDFDTSSGTFAVFVDRAPMPPGRGLKWLARGDDFCEDVPGCPDEAYLSSRGVYTTSDTNLTLDAVPELDREDTRELHEVTIVLLNGEGKRIGESAFEIEFKVEDED